MQHHRNRGEPVGLLRPTANDMTPFLRAASTFARLEKTRSRLEMVRILADLFQELEAGEIQPAVYLLQGRLGPSYDAPDFGISEKLTSRVIVQFSGKRPDEVERLYRKLGDHGLVAEQLLAGGTRLQPRPATTLKGRTTTTLKGRTTKSRLTIQQVYDELMELARASGAGSVEKKVGSLVALLGRASPLEAKYLLRIPVGRMRLGVGDATVLDGLGKAKSIPRALIERAYNLCSDLGLVARTLYEGGEPALKRFRVQVGRPIKMQFAERVKNFDELVRRLGTCAAEPKYDGFRCQVHKDGKRVRIFSRNQEDTTQMLPDIVRATIAQIGAARAIFEGEALAYDPETDEFQPFQVTVQRKRVYDIDKMQETLPLRLNAFDLLYADGDDLTPRPYRERRKALEKLIKKGTGLAVAPALVSGDRRELELFFEAQLGGGLEGIVAKRLDSAYEAGKRNFNWIKFKRAYHGELKDTLDLTIVGYFAGRGARAALGIGAVLGAVYDKKNDRFRTIAKVASGLSEADWIALRKQLEKRRVKSRPARVDSRLEPPYWVEPTLVVEVFADEITRSPVHTAGLGRDAAHPASGLALRFPRIVRGVRADRTPEDATSEDEVMRLFGLQKRGRAG
jgi:DNA ligase 1